MLSKSRHANRAWSMAAAPESDPTQSLDKLRELFLLLEPHDASVSDEDQDKQAELREVLDYYLQCSRRITDYLHIQTRTANKCNFSNIVPRFMQLLRESVLSHQWPQALKLVQTLCKEMKGTDTTIWKVGLACLFQDKERNQRLVEQFVKHVYVLQKLAVVEVMLDYLLFLMTQSNIEDAKQLVQELKQNTLFPSQLTNEKRKNAHTLFFAYQGLTLYAEWKLAIFKADNEEDNESDIISLMVSQGASGQAAKSIADSAIDFLVKVKDLPGVWDIFLTRLVEIYDYYGNQEEARRVLHAYRDRNLTNPNAHRYLYEFESKHDGELDIQIRCLKDLLKLDPSNPLCLTLYELTEASDTDAVSLLFDFLDYDHCQNNEDVWEALATKVQGITDNPHLSEVIQQCWETRRDWWPYTVFSNMNSVELEKQPPLSVVQNKRIVQQALQALENG